MALINDANDQWVRAARRLSPRVTRDLLGWAGEQANAYFAARDPHALGGSVEWAGRGPAPWWLEIAREYTERWVHQQQVREAVSASPLDEARLFAPVLATFVRALPWTYRTVAAPPATAVTIFIEGDAGGDWTLLRTADNGWTLHAGAAEAPAARVRLDQDTAWRLATRALPAGEEERRVRVEGDATLGGQVRAWVAILA